ncbi:MAG: heme biosynthesis protein HemY, partial [Maricaulaceae bacterium]
PAARVCGRAAQVAHPTGDLAAAHEWIHRAGAARREPDWSDLDPEGPAFAYEPGDWARLVYSFGDSGELIHPRHERYEPEKDTVPSDPAVGLPPPKGPVETEAEYESAPAGRAPGPEDAPVADDEASPDATENEATEVTAEEDDAGGRRRGVFRRR